MKPLLQLMSFMIRLCDAFCSSVTSLHIFRYYYLLCRDCQIVSVQMSLIRHLNKYDFIYFIYFISFAQKNTENNTSNKNVTIH